MTRDVLTHTTQYTFVVMSEGKNVHIEDTATANIKLQSKIGKVSKPPRSIKGVALKSIKQESQRLRRAMKGLRVARLKPSQRSYVQNVMTRRSRFTFDLLMTPARNGETFCMVSSPKKFDRNVQMALDRHIKERHDNAEKMKNAWLCAPAFRSTRELLSNSISVNEELVCEAIAAKNMGLPLSSEKQSRLALAHSHNVLAASPFPRKHKVPCPPYRALACRMQKGARRKLRMLWISFLNSVFLRAMTFANIRGEMMESCDIKQAVALCMQRYLPNDWAVVQARQQCASLLSKCKDYLSRQKEIKQKREKQSSSAWSVALQPKAARRKAAAAATKKSGKQPKVSGKPAVRAKKVKAKSVVLQQKEEEEDGDAGAKVQLAAESPANDKESSEEEEEEDEDEESSGEEEDEESSGEEEDEELSAEEDDEESSAEEEDEESSDEEEDEESSGEEEDEESPGEEGEQESSEEDEESLPGEDDGDDRMQISSEEDEEDEKEE